MHFKAHEHWNSVAKDRWQQDRQSEKKIRDGHRSEIQQYFTHLGPDLKTVTVCKAKLLTVQRIFSNKNLKILTQWIQ